MLISIGSFVAKRRASTDLIVADFIVALKAQPTDLLATRCVARVRVQPTAIRKENKIRQHNQSGQSAVQRGCNTQACTEGRCHCWLA